MAQSPQTSTALPPGQQLAAPDKWPVIGEKQPGPGESTWNLTIANSRGESAVLSPEQWRALPCRPFTIDIHCVTRWSKLGISFRGVLLADALSVIPRTPADRFVSFVARSSRGHSTSLRLDEALRLGTFLAWECEGRPISSEHGGPLRNIVPSRYFYKSVKWLERIDLLREDRLGFWEATAGYHNEADPWRQQRYLACRLDRREAAALIQSRDFSGRDLRSLDASGRQLDGLNARQALLRDARFCRASLQRADFRGANLSNADFRAANLRGADFRQADVEGADFAAADLRGADLRGCSLCGTTFCRENAADPSGARIDATTQLDSVDLQALTPLQFRFVTDATRGAP